MSIHDQLTWGAVTDRGRRRAENQDGYLADPPVFVVADGMGGHEGGAEASRRALAGFAALVGRVDVTSRDVEDAFAAAVAAVAELSSGTASAAGTTLSGVVACEQGGEPYWLVINIGDSRTYRLSAGRLEQISVDHSAVQQLIDLGRVSEAEAEHHPDRNVVTRAIGAGSSGAPDYWLIPAEAGDRLLVCSDGLTKELSTEEIRRALRDGEPPQETAARLVQLSLDRGGRDNVTVVVLDAPSGDGYAGDDDHDTVPAGVLDDDTRPSAPRDEEEMHRAQL